MPVYAGHRPTSTSLLAGGIVNGVNAGIGITGAVVLMPGGTSYYILGAAPVLLGTICLIGAIGSLSGTVFCIKRKSFGLALTGSIIGMIFGGTVLGIVATILVVVGKNDFIDRPPAATSPVPPFVAPGVALPHGSAPPVSGAPVKYCARCGTQLPAKAEFCSRCGSRT